MHGVNVIISLLLCHAGFERETIVAEVIGLVILWRGITQTKDRTMAKTTIDNDYVNDKRGYCCNCRKILFKGDIITVALNGKTRVKARFCSSHCQVDKTQKNISGGVFPGHWNNGE